MTDRIQTAVRLPRDLHERLTAHVERLNARSVGRVSLNDYIVHVLDAAIQRPQSDLESRRKRTKGGL